jgi:hypothetical protein
VIVTSKAELQNYLFTQGGVIYDKLSKKVGNINQYLIEVDVNTEFGSPMIGINLENKDNYHKDKRKWL